MKKRFALDLYGGKKAVLERMELLVRDKLSSISDEYRNHIYEEIREEKNPDKFIEILDGKKKVDFRTFDMLKDSYLEMNIDDILGKADLDPVIRKYWIAQTKINPMLISANKPDIDEKTLEDYVLHSYVQKKAIAELFADNRNKRVA